LKSSVSRSRRSTTDDLIVSGYEAVAIILNQRWRQRRIPEARVFVRIWSSSLCNIALRCFNSCVIALPIGISERCRGRRRGIDNDRPRNTTSQ
jgi:hypothetical protein